jgi:hypothetical protein
MAWNTVLGPTEGAPPGTSSLSSAPACSSNWSAVPVQLMTSRAVRPRSLSGTTSVLMAAADVIDATRESGGGSAAAGELPLDQPQFRLQRARERGAARGRGVRWLLDRQASGTCAAMALVRNAETPSWCLP